MISIDKKYRTRSGLEVLILYTTANSDNPVLGMVTAEDGRQYGSSWTKEGRYLSPDTVNPYDLVEVQPYDDIKIDDKVLVQTPSGEPLKRYFAGVHKTTKNPMVWADGATSWSTQLPPEPVHPTVFLGKAE